ncbi:MAG TPA: sigma-70 family RNA polymerase sigma factor [Ensifer sp.]|jgi:RNA polymerase sigma-70 factor (ECF subfamily)|uniref:RNA polymerase sigma factor n=1 Tax=Ensifer sp. TaxID=1872086 RepID=UPI002E129447|nr:sigma-70 family RNA polymerase sigma factor [Ensifer sp.]
MTEHLTPAHYSDLLRFARRQTRRVAEAEDLLHEALIVALKAQRFPTGDDRAWFCGVIRRLAAMQARTAARRQRREQQASLPEAESPAGSNDPLVFAATLAPALRIVLLLAVAGHNRPEIRHLLRISDEALRQRILHLRRAWRDAGNGESSLELVGLRFPLESGRIRQALLPVTRGGQAAFASHDPDGHLFAVSFSSHPSHKTATGGNKPA